MNIKIQAYKLYQKLERNKISQVKAEKYMPNYVSKLEGNRLDSESSNGDTISRAAGSHIDNNSQRRRYGTGGDEIRSVQHIRNLNTNEFELPKKRFD